MFVFIIYSKQIFLDTTKFGWTKNWGTLPECPHGYGPARISDSIWRWWCKLNIIGIYFLSASLCILTCIILDLTRIYWPLLCDPLLWFNFFLQLLQFPCNSGLNLRALKTNCCVFGLVPQWGWKVNPDCCQQLRWACCGDTIPSVLLTWKRPRNQRRRDPAGDARSTQKTTDRWRIFRFWPWSPLIIGFGAFCSAQRIETNRYWKIGC